MPVERRNSGFIVSLDGRPSGFEAEYPKRSTMRAAEMQGRLDAIEAWCRKLVRVPEGSR
jgi:hypothetical protein